MLVTVPETLTVQQNFFLGRFGQLSLGAGGRRYQPTNLYTAGSPAALQLADENARSLITLDDATGLQNPDPTPYLDADKHTPGRQHRRRCHRHAR
jgi:predicted extracellular nuclease